MLESKTSVYLTLEQVNKALDEGDQRKKERNLEPCNRKEFEHFGFKCIYNYCKLEFGWVASMEDCCPYCVAYLVREYGSESDKKHFNSAQTLGDAYRIPMTRKEIAESNRKKYKRTRNKKSKMKRKGSRKRLARTQNKEHQEFLKRLRSAGVPILRRTKKTAKRDLILVSLSKKLRSELDIGFCSYVYVKGVRSQGGYLYISSQERLAEHVNKVCKSSGVTPPEKLVIL